MVSESRAKCGPSRPWRELSSNAMHSSAGSGQALAPHTCPLFPVTCSLLCESHSQNRAVQTCPFYPGELCDSASLREMRLRLQQFFKASRRDVIFVPEKGGSLTACRSEICRFLSFSRRLGQLIRATAMIAAKESGWECPRTRKKPTRRARQPELARRDRFGASSGPFPLR